VEIVAAGRDVEPHHLPPWVVQQHLQFHAASELPHDDGPLRAVRIDGVSFRKYGSSWGTERGRRAQLIEQDGTFIVVMVDGTRSTFGRAARDVRWSKDDGRLSAQLGRLLGGRLQRIEDRYGTPVMFSYADGPAGVQVSQMVDAVGRTFSFQYVHADVAPNAFHPSSVRLVRVDALGSDGAELEYDRASGRLSNVRIGRFVEHYDYEAVPGATAFPEHRLTRITRSDGTSEQTLSLAYHWASDLPAALFATHPGLSPQQVVARVGFEDERFVFFNYHSDDGNRRSVTFPDGTEVYELDPSGNAVSVQGRGKSRRWQWGIDSAFAGNDLLSVQDLITNQTTRYEYDDRGNRVKTIGPDGGVLRDTFDEWGLLVRRILPNGDVHREQRDSLGNLLHEADVDGTFTDYLYGPGGLPTQGSNQQGVQWLYQYDEDQNLERIDHGDRRYTRFEHDAYGRLLRETSPEGKVDEHRYDTLGREVYRRVDGKETVITYDVLDRATESAPAAR
jgi:YD repeat-containing protein